MFRDSLVNLGGKDVYYLGAYQMISRPPKEMFKTVLKGETVKVFESVAKTSISQVSVQKHPSVTIERELLNVLLSREPDWRPAISSRLADIARQERKTLAANAPTAATPEPHQPPVQQQGAAGQKPVAPQTELAAAQSASTAPAAASARELHARGVELALQGQFNNAIEEFNKTIAADPGFGRAYLNRGIAHAKAGNSDKAAADFAHCCNIKFMEGCVAGIQWAMDKSGKSLAFSKD